MKNKATKSLLQKILDRRVKPTPNQQLSQEAIEEGEVLVEWVLGNIETKEAADALGVKATSQIHQRAGTSLRNLADGKYISITWNRMEEEESAIDAVAGQAAEGG